MVTVANEQFAKTSFGLLKAFQHPQNASEIVVMLPENKLYIIIPPSNPTSIVKPSAKELPRFELPLGSSIHSASTSDTSELQMQYRMTEIDGMVSDLRKQKLELDLKEKELKLKLVEMELQLSIAKVSEKKTKKKAYKLELELLSKDAQAENSAANKRLETPKTKPSFTRKGHPSSSQLTDTPSQTLCASLNISSKSVLQYVYH